MIKLYISIKLILYKQVENNGGFVRVQGCVYDENYQPSEGIMYEKLHTSL